MKHIKVKDEYDEIAELEKQLEKTEPYRSKKQAVQKRKDLLFTLTHGIIGSCRLLVVCSIIYSSLVVLNGMEGLIPRILIIPQALLAAFFTVEAFINSNIKRSKK